MLNLAGETEDRPASASDAVVPSAEVVCAAEDGAGSEVVFGPGPTWRHSRAINSLHITLGSSRALAEFGSRSGSFVTGEDKAMAVVSGTAVASGASGWVGPCSMAVAGAGHGGWKGQLGL